MNVKIRDLSTLPPGDDVTIGSSTRLKRWFLQAAKLPPRSYELETNATFEVMRFAFGEGLAGGIWIFSDDGLSFSRLMDGDPNQENAEFAFENSVDELRGDERIGRERLTSVVTEFATNGKRIAGGWVGDDEPTIESTPEAYGLHAAKLVKLMRKLPAESHPPVAALVGHSAARRDENLAAFLAAYAEHGIGDLSLGDWWADPPELIDDKEIQIGKTPDGHPVIAGPSGISVPTADDIGGVANFESWLSELVFNADDGGGSTSLSS